MKSAECQCLSHVDVSQWETASFEWHCLGLVGIKKSICGQWLFCWWFLSFVGDDHWASSNASCHCLINCLQSIQQSSTQIKRDNKGLSFLLNWIGSECKGSDWNKFCKTFSFPLIEVGLIMSTENQSLVALCDASSHMFVVSQGDGSNKSSISYLLSIHSLIKWDRVMSWIMSPAPHHLLVG